MSILKSLEFNLQNSCAIKSKIQQAVNIQNGLIIDLCHCTVLIVQVFQIMLEKKPLHNRVPCKCSAFSQELF